MKLTADRLRELLHYDPDTGVFTWRVSRRGCFARVGARAGFPRADGYCRITLDDSRYYCHRLAWLYIHGCWPADQIDHANGDPSDNRLLNLRSADPSKNTANSRLTRRSTTGYKGVSFNRRQKKWIANIGVNYKAVHLGAFESPDEAHAAYRAAASAVFGEFARFE